VLGHVDTHETLRGGVFPPVFSVVENNPDVCADDPYLRSFCVRDLARQDYGALAPLLHTARLLQSPPRSAQELSEDVFRDLPSGPARLHRTLDPGDGIYAQFASDLRTWCVMLVPRTPRLLQYVLPKSLLQRFAAMLGEIPTDILVDEEGVVLYQHGDFFVVQGTANNVSPLHRDLTGIACSQTEYLLVSGGAEPAAALAQEALEAGLLSAPAKRKRLASAFRKAGDTATSQTLVSA
jgi:hypothetical protein